jgi:predicted AlkP superfamily pyrophosphatase or phosphodiesterase
VERFIKHVTLTALTGAVLAFGGILAVGAQAPAGVPRAATGTEPPRLIVVLVVDQFTSRYVETYGHQWSQGLRRLFATGAEFPQAAYPYGYTVTCAGHHSIGTGTAPATHGLIGNDWYDRTSGRSMPCTSAPGIAPVAFAGGAVSEHHGPVWLKTPTLAEELRLQSSRPPRVLSLSLKARSAIGLAGHGGPNTMVVWEEDNGSWATSEAYTKVPWPEVDEYVKTHPIAASYGDRWERVLPADRYLFTDDVPQEPAPRVFPHLLTSKSGKPDGNFVTQWERSPWSDAYLGAMAAALVERLELGQQPGTDYLAVSFSALDLVGHQFGPRSHEVQDVLVRLDAVLGRLFSTLDRVVGASRYTVAFSADHGVAPFPEHSASSGIDAGRTSAGAVRQAIQGALVAAFGEGTYVANAAVPNVVLAPGVLDRVLARPDVMRAVETAVMAVPGIARVYWAPQLADLTSTDDPILRAMRLSYVAGRSGDLNVVLRPYWLASGSGTSHGTPYLYDQRVPVVFMGAGIQRGRYLTAATPLDIAPTLAAIAGIQLTRTDGRVLVDAIAKP